MCFPSSIFFFYGLSFNFLIIFNYMLFLQWFLRDLTGMLGGILFTFYQVSNSLANSNRQCHLIAIDSLFTDEITCLLSILFVYRVY